MQSVTCEQEWSVRCVWTGNVNAVCYMHEQEMWMHCVTWCECSVLYVWTANVNVVCFMWTGSVNAVCYMWTESMNEVCYMCEWEMWMQYVTCVKMEHECCLLHMNRERECSVLHLWTGSVNAVCYVSTDEPIQSYTSTVVKNSSNPFWDEHFLLWVFLGFHPLSTYNYWESLSFYSNWESPCRFVFLKVFVILFTWRESLSVYIYWESLSYLLRVLSFYSH